MESTKQKIINASLRLFNQKGLVNVRLQHIADEVGISVGNLAYHFYSKTAIVKTIDEQLSEQIASILSDKRVFPHLIDFDNQLSHYYYLSKNYSFYFLDLVELERAYPNLNQKRKGYIQGMNHQIENWFDYNVQQARLTPEIRPGHYQNIAHTIWMIITFWNNQLFIRGMPNKGEHHFKKAVWSQVLPYFTPLGNNEFELLILPMLERQSFDSENEA